MKEPSERIERHKCPKGVQARLTLAGGRNSFGEPNFRLVWGYDRIVKMHGLWEEVEPGETVRTGLYDTQGKEMILVRPTKVKNAVIETRELPKYLPGNCWHLEKWCPPEMYGSPEAWRLRGMEVHGGATLDTAGEFPSRGEYELVQPLTVDGTPETAPLPLEPAVIELTVRLIQASVDFSMSQRLAAIQQREEWLRKKRIDRNYEILREGRRAFSGHDFVVVPATVN